MENTTSPETTTEPKITRHRRTDEEILADLQRRQDEVRARSQAREVKSAVKEDDLGGAILGAIQAIDRATRKALAAEDPDSAERLEAARAPLGAILVSKFGIKAPSVRLKVGGRPKGSKTEPESES